MAWLILLFHIFLSITHEAAEGQKIAKDGCPEKCGVVAIPYPFGIGPQCSHPAGGFELKCIARNGTKVPFHGDFEVQSIVLTTAQARMYNHISWQCYDFSTREIISSIRLLNLLNTFYTLSSIDNMFVVVGCDTSAFSKMWKWGTDINHSNPYRAGCGSNSSPNQSLSTNGSCSDNGCCQTSIPSGINYYNVSFDEKYYGYDVRDSHCSYAVIMATDSFKFSTSYNSTIDFWSAHNDTVPLVLDWSIGNETCKVAQANMSNYACVSSNSVCVDSTNGPGYVCNCSKGYQGNPYFLDGCQDVNECAYPDLYPCFGICINEVGHYRCSHNKSTNKKLIILVGIGTGIGLITIVQALHIFIKKIKLRTKKIIRERLFKQNHGILLQQLISSNRDVNERLKIFTLEELEKATNKFDQTRIVGHGGHGTVYKGILSDQRVVAIKKSQIVIQREIDQFINEVVILSQIDHRNVVKLYGCCLESEIPLLVYEFISNGTLFDHLHIEGYHFLSWDDRFRIMLEIAKALAHLHSTASISVFHRDIKSSNVLLDDYLTVKVSDFGASKSIQINQTGISITTAVQGTYGYLDPEYFYTGRLTEKSDVYSFSVILAELLTREKSVSSTRFREGENLASHFCTTVRDNKLTEILDPEIAGEGNLEKIEAVAVIAEMCLKLKGEERPTMKEVEMKIEMLHGSKKQGVHPWANANRSDTRQRLMMNNTSIGETSRVHSLEQEYMLSLLFCSDHGSF